MKSGSSNVKLSGKQEEKQLFAFQQVFQQALVNDSFLKITTLTNQYFNPSPIQKSPSLSLFFIFTIEYIETTYKLKHSGETIYSDTFLPDPTFRNYNSKRESRLFNQYRESMG